MNDLRIVLARDNDPPTRDLGRRRLTVIDRGGPVISGLNADGEACPVRAFDEAARAAHASSSRSQASVPDHRLLGDPLHVSLGDSRAARDIRHRDPRPTENLHLESLQHPVHPFRSRRSALRRIGWTAP